jgi:ribulose-phosphate 3-epimerase
MKNTLIAPSILAADFADLLTAVHIIENSDADWYHLDVMDGVFVPNISFGIPVIESLKKRSTKPFDVHLMIVQPDRYIQAFKNAGADVLTVHYEADNHLHRTLNGIRQAGMKSGVALNPHTPVHLLSEILPLVDVVCMMSVNPGFGGQKFIENTYRKVAQLKEMIVAQKTNTLIEIDGGVVRSNAKALIDAGADVLVAGSAVFGAANPVEEVKILKNA